MDYSKKSTPELLNEYDEKLEYVFSSLSKKKQLVLEQLIEIEREFIKRENI